MTRAGLFRDILVRPPKIYYPGVLPNVALFNAMHRNPTVTAKSLKFFTYVACATFIYQWFPGFIFPMLSSLPLLCYMGHGNWIAYLMGSGYNGFVSSAIFMTGRTYVPGFQCCSMMFLVIETSQ